MSDRTLARERDHRKTMGLIYLVVGIVELLALFLVTAIILYVGLVWSFDAGHDTNPMQTVLLSLTLVALMLYPLPSIISGFGLWKQKNLSEVWTWIATVLHLFNVPLGTVVGAYGLWVITRPR